MRITVAFCLFAVFCTVYAASPPLDNLETLKLQVKNAIWNVEHVIQRLERVRIETEEDTLITITKRWWEQMDSHRDYVNLLLASMRREVNNAKIRNTNAQHCYNANFCGISQHTDTAYKSAMKCKEAADKSIKSSLGFLDSLVSLGKTLIEDLNQIFLNCHSDDDLKKQVCILTELGKLSVTVNSFEEDAKYIEYSALPASNYVILQASKCLSNAYLLAHFECEGAMMSHSRCVREALDSKKSLIAY